MTSRLCIHHHVVGAMVAVLLSLRIARAHGLSSFLGAAHQQTQLNHGIVATSLKLPEQDNSNDSWLASLENASSSQADGAQEALKPIRKMGTKLSDEFPKAFDDCALIGSSAILNNSRRGPEIDTHGTVVRVNRLPTNKYYADFGKRTEIVILDKKLSMAKTIQHLGDTHLTQGFQCEATEKQCSNFSVIITTVGIEDTDERHKIQGEWAHAPVPIGEISPLPHLVADGIPTMENVVPSTGFKAFLAFASVCNKLTVYGFGGTKKTADGHKVVVASADENHDFELENRIIDKIANGTMRYSDWGINETTISHNEYHARIRYAFARMLTGRNVSIEVIRD